MEMELYMRGERINTRNLSSGIAFITESKIVKHVRLDKKNIPKNVTKEQ